jgi:membrane dipeptidase
LGPLAWRGANAKSRPIGVVDLHVDLSYQLNYKHQGLERGSGQYLAGEALASGVAGVVLPLYVPKDVSPEGPRLEDFEASYQRLTLALQATPPYSLPGSKLPDRVRTWPAFEGSAPFVAGKSSYEKWLRRGAKFFGLVHTYDNALGSSAGATPNIRSTKAGLTQAGKAFVKELLRAGGIVDVSHASDKTIQDVIQLSEAEHVPVVATHSNARSITRHARNLTDDQIRSIAKTGGVIGVNFHTPFLTSEARRATLADVIRHIDHIKRIGGIDHIAIGSDFEGGIRPPDALADVRGFPTLAAALLARGYTHAEVQKIFGLNALRVLCRNTDGTISGACASL